MRLRYHHGGSSKRAYLLDLGKGFPCASWHLVPCLAGHGHMAGECLCTRSKCTRGTTLLCRPVQDDTSPDGPSAAAQEPVPFTTSGLATARAGVVSSFSALAGAEDAALLDGLLGRVLQALGHEGDQDGKGAASTGDGTGSVNGSGDGPGGGGAAAAAAGGVAQPNAEPQEAKQVGVWVAQSHLLGRCGDAALSCACGTP